MAEARAATPVRAEPRQFHDNNSLNREVAIDLMNLRRVETALKHREIKHKICLIEHQMVNPDTLV